MILTDSTKFKFLSNYNNIMPALAHFGIGLMAKKILPKLPLWALLVCAMGIDILAIFFMWAPIWTTHSVFMGTIWSILSIPVSYIILKNLNSKKKTDEQNENSNSKYIIRTSLLIGLLVFSHIILDFIGWPMTVLNPENTGIPILFDLSQNIGLGVYRTWTGALLMDLGVFIIGIFIYQKQKAKK